MCVHPSFRGAAGLTLRLDAYIMHVIAVEVFRYLFFYIFDYSVSLSWVQIHLFELFLFLSEIRFPYCVSR